MHDSPNIAMLEGKYKFLTNRSESGAEDLLFDIVADRAETQNLVTENAKLAQAMKQRLRTWRAGTRTVLAGPTAG